METPENNESTETTSAANGSTPPPSVKPWIAAGFKSRDEWRASKGHKTGKKPKVKTDRLAAIKAAAAKPKKATKKVKNMVAKKGKWASKYMEEKSKKMKAKKAKRAKLAVKGKEDKRKKPAAPKKGSVKDASMEPVALSELSARCKKVFLAASKGKTTTIEEIEAKAFNGTPHKKANSVIRNQLRFLRVHRMVKMLGDGKYKRVA